jgi:hypothetical protein
VRDLGCFLGDTALQRVVVGSVGVRRGDAQGGLGRRLVGCLLQAAGTWRRGQAGCLLGELRRLLSLRIGIVLLLRLEK